MDYQQYKALVFPDVRSRHGAPMGRYSCGGLRPTSVRLYDRAVPMSDGYDRGEAYWGYPHNLRCTFTADGSYRLYYRG